MINDFLENYVGFTAKQSVLDDIHKSLLQERSKAIGYENKAVPIASVTVQDLKSKEILGIGASVPGDLINNNFGELFAGIHGPLTDNRTFVGLTQISGAGPFTIRVWRPVSGTVWDNVTQSLVQVGSGITAPTRGDFNIETPFASAPESTRVLTGNGGYNASLGTVSVTTNISPTGGAGTVNETNLFWAISNDAGSSVFFLMSRDIISPGVSFVGGQAIIPVYTWQI